jgi:hypothetical protein
MAAGWLARGTQLWVAFLGVVPRWQQVGVVVSGACEWATYVALERWQGQLVHAGHTGDALYHRVTVCCMNALEVEGYTGPPRCIKHGMV